MVTLTTVVRDCREKKRSGWSVDAVENEGEGERNRTAALVPTCSKKKGINKTTTQHSRENESE